MYNYIHREYRNTQKGQFAYKWRAIRNVPLNVHQAPDILEKQIAEASSYCYTY